MQIRSALLFTATLTATALLVVACTDDASLCREPGYTCSGHGSKDRLCVLPGYTCTPSEGESVSPVTGQPYDAGPASGNSGSGVNDGPAE